MGIEVSRRHGAMETRRGDTCCIGHVMTTVLSVSLTFTRFSNYFKLIRPSCSLSLQCSDTRFCSYCEEKSRSIHHYWLYYSSYTTFR